VDMLLDDDNDDVLVVDIGIGSAVPLEGRLVVCLSR